MCLMTLNATQWITISGDGVSQIVSLYCSDVALQRTKTTQETVSSECNHYSSASQSDIWIGISHVNFRFYTTYVVWNLGLTWENSNHQLNYLWWWIVTSISQIMDVVWSPDWLIKCNSRGYELVSEWVPSFLSGCSETDLGHASELCNTATGFCASWYNPSKVWHPGTYRQRYLTL